MDPWKDTEALCGAILGCSSISNDTRDRARDMLRRLNGEWTWGCIVNGVNPRNAEVSL